MKLLSGRLGVPARMSGIHSQQIRPITWLHGRVTHHSGAVFAGAEDSSRPRSSMTNRSCVPLLRGSVEAGRRATSRGRAVQPYRAYTVGAAHAAAAAVMTDRHRLRTRASCRRLAARACLLALTEAACEEAVARCRTSKSSTPRPSCCWIRSLPSRGAAGAGATKGLLRGGNSLEVSVASRPAWQARGRTEGGNSPSADALKGSSWL